MDFCEICVWLRPGAQNRIGSEQVPVGSDKLKSSLAHAGCRFCKSSSRFRKVSWEFHFRESCVRLRPGAQNRIYSGQVPVGSEKLESSLAHAGYRFHKGSSRFQWVPWELQFGKVAFGQGLVPKTKQVPSRFQQVPVCSEKPMFCLASIRCRFRRGSNMFQKVPWKLHFVKYCVWLRPGAPGRVRFRARSNRFWEAESRGCTAKRE